jgi:glycosyltransferase involved in cell wall biosynthesis
MKKTEVKVSVILPVCNAERYIEDCIKALLTQSYPEDCYEIIAIDNNSTDGSTEIIKHYPHIKLLMEHKQGSYAARNQGITEAKGEIIAFTDSDSAVSTDWLHNIVSAMCHPETRVVLGRCQLATDSLLLSMMADYEAEKATYACSSDDEHVYYGYTNNMATRANLFNKLGPFLEIDRGADVIFVLRVVDEYSCSAVCYSPDVCVRHLEITSIWDYYQKRYIYGQSYKKYHKIKSARPLSSAERLKVFKATWQKNKYSLLKSSLLFFILAVGAVYYELGRKSFRQSDFDLLI